MLMPARVSGKCYHLNLFGVDILLMNFCDMVIATMSMLND